MVSHSWPSGKTNSKAFIPNEPAGQQLSITSQAGVIAD
jgi:hypothetical protein